MVADVEGFWKVDERGRGHGKYCMARFGASGAYEVGNVEIIESDQNGSDQYLVHPTQRHQ